MPEFERVNAAIPPREAGAALPAARTPTSGVPTWQEAYAGPRGRDRGLVGYTGGMDVLHWVLLSVSLVLAGVCGWAVLRLAGARSQTAVAEEGMRGERERRERAEGALAGVTADLAQVREALSRAEAQGAALRALAEQLKQERADDAREAERRQAEAVEAERALHRQQAASQQREHAAALKAVEEARAEIEKRLRQFEGMMKESFGSLAGAALKQSSEQFLALAQQRLATEHEKSVGEVEKKKAEIASMVAPIADTLRKTDEKLGKMQEQWAGDRASIAEQVRAVGRAGETLREETGKLVKALGRPEVRGRYGEIQLRRVAELAGMVPYCDFAEQESVRDEEGRLLRPDLVVRLPNERVIAVDAKTNTYAYVEAANAAGEEEREAHLERFARHVAEQVRSLADRRYWSRFNGSPDFVVMFLPGDQFLDAALQRRPDLIEQSAAANVLLATPATLIGLLRAVAVGWREHRLAREAAELLELGKELHKRSADALEHVERLGTNLRRAVEAYNGFVGSFERGMSPTLRKFEEAGVKSAKALAEPPSVEVMPRALTAGRLDGGSIGRDGA